MYFLTNYYGIINMNMYPVSSKTSNAFESCRMTALCMCSPLIGSSAKRQICSKSWLVCAHVRIALKTICVQLIKQHNNGKIPIDNGH